MLRLTAFGALCALPMLCSAEPLVRLDIVTQDSLVEIGDTVAVDLVVTPLEEADFRVGGVAAVLNWDPVALQLAGVVTNENPDYEWFLAGFNDDSGLDDLNNGVTTEPIGLPDNDGNAFFEALAQFGLQNRPTVTSGGLKVVRILFQALAANVTEISIPLGVGEHTASAVFLGDGPPGVNILGGTQNTIITIVPEPGSAALLGALGIAILCKRRNAATI